MIALADRWVRKAVYDALSPLSVGSIDVPLYDTYTTSSDDRFYILMTTQTADELQPNKCESRLTGSLLLDIVTRYRGRGNVGSRLLSDQIAEQVVVGLDGLQLDVASGLDLYNLRFSFPNDLTIKTDSENIFRKLIRLEYFIQKK